jgi:hypothetical protein
MHLLTVNVINVVKQWIETMIGQKIAIHVPFVEKPKKINTIGARIVKNARNAVKPETNNMIGAIIAKNVSNVEKRGMIIIYGSRMIALPVPFVES